MNTANELTDQSIELLRFSTCGSVDDGKSTLIGRLLYDSKSLLQDQIEALERTVRGGEEGPNLANLTDGLRAEREQGITIDVAYRFLATPRRRFIVADTPGHIQYTRNMVTGASTANLAIILVDARHGVIEQTRRHSYITSLLGIRHLVICVNKMDLVDFDETVFNRIRSDFDGFATHLNVQDITYIPVSALQGDNVVTLSANMPWYAGPPLLQLLETVHIANDHEFTHGRFPVQWVIRPRSDDHHDFRGYAGRVAGGVFRPGDSVIILPSGQRSRIREIRHFEDTLNVAYPPMSVTMLLEDDIDISRGDLIVPEDSIPYLSQDIDAMVCWLHQTPMQVGRRYRLKHNTSTSRVVVKDLVHAVNVNTLAEDTETTTLNLNEIGKVRIRSQRLLAFDDYQRNRTTGSFILIDETTNATVGAGMICEPTKPAPMPEFEGYVI